MSYIINRPLAKQAARNCMRTARVSPYQIALVLVLMRLPSRRRAALATRRSLAVCTVLAAGALLV